MLFNGTGGGGAARGADGWPLFESIDGLGRASRRSRSSRSSCSTRCTSSGWRSSPTRWASATWIGGPGTRLEVRSLGGEMECVTFGDGVANPPHGAIGGTPGHGGGAYVEDPIRRRAGSSPPTGLVRVGSTSRGSASRPAAAGTAIRRARPADRVAATFATASFRARRPSASSAWCSVPSSRRRRRGDDRALRDRLRAVARPPFEPSTPVGVDLGRAEPARRRRLPPEPAVSSRLRIGVDIGGTFTDFTVLGDDGSQLAVEGGLDAGRSRPRDHARAWSPSPSSRTRPSRRCSDAPSCSSTARRSRRTA